MACTQPLTAWKWGYHPSGKQKLVFTDPHEEKAERQKVPCGKCTDCKLSYSRQWATRIMHEMQTCKIGCFVTLTINEEQLIRTGFTRREKFQLEEGHEWRDVYYPPNSVYKRSIQLFMKRLRKATAIDVPNPDTGRTKKVYQKFRYVAAGEYGDKKGRPHYHIAILGLDFPDKYYWRTTPRGDKCYRSPALEKLWTYGQSEIGEITFQSAAYLARYTLKKSSDKRQYEQAYGYDPETGEILFDQLNPEFITMSKGIGSDWWKKYKHDTDKDYLVIDYDKKVKIPRYYDKKREDDDPESLAKIKELREAKALELDATDTKRRKLARATVKQAQNTMLKRSLDHGTETPLLPVR
ncbi:replication initiator protein [Microviridae sp.]|nr:replication initiator protein [Microviridae sp.]